jgi:hypothetical protein
MRTSHTGNAPLAMEVRQSDPVMRAAGTGRLGSVSAV